MKHDYTTKTSATTILSNLCSENPGEILMSSFNRDHSNGARASMKKPNRVFKYIHVIHKGVNALSTSVKRLQNCMHRRQRLYFSLIEGIGHTYPPSLNGH